MKKYHLIVIGGGSGGLIVALGAVRFGLRVALIEKEKLGGDCLWTGCVPSKTLIHSAGVAQIIREAHRFGLHHMEPSFSPADVLEHVRSVQARIAEHDDPERFREQGIDVIFGSPRFLDATHIQIGEETVEGKKFVLATGGRPAVFPIPGLEETGYITNVDVFKLKDLPPSLIHIGGGPISIELCQAFRRLGSDVTVIDKATHILPREDADMANALRECLEREGVRFMTGVDVKECRKENGGKAVVFEKDGTKTTVRADEILAALGRAANVAGLGLEKAGVQYTPKGVVVDDYLRTTAPNIWAVGDVKDKYLFTHVAEYEARVVVQNALFPFRKKVDYRVIPWCTFTDPELARVGLSEEEAQKTGIPHRVFALPFSEVDRAQTDGETAGMAKIICNPKGKILGAILLGAHAGELIHEWALAMKEGIPISHLSGLIHIYPTLSRVSRKVADKYYGEILSGKKGRFLNFMARLTNR